MKWINCVEWIKHNNRTIWVLGLAIFALALTAFTSNTFFTPVQEAWTVPLAGRTIVVDPGHGGPDGGAFRSGLYEKDVTLKISLYLRDFLQEAGALVVMTREKDEDLALPNVKKLALRKAQDLFRRVQIAQEKHADVFLSIHLNAIPSEKWYGAQTFFNPIYEKNKRLASFIQAGFIRYLENTTRFPKQKGDTYILRTSRVPTALLEVGFLSNPIERNLLADTNYQKKVAAAIYYGVLSYFTKSEPPVF